MLPSSRDPVPRRQVPDLQCDGRGPPPRRRSGVLPAVAEGALHDLRPEGADAAPIVRRHRTETQTRSIDRRRRTADQVPAGPRSAGGHRPPHGRPRRPAPLRTVPRLDSHSARPTCTCSLADPVTLFDCGPNTPATENALLLGLAAIGVAPEQVARIVVSHGHPDHYGMAPRLRETSGAQILVGERDLPKLADGSMLVATGRLLLQAGMPMEELVEIGERERKLGPGIRPEIEEATALRGGERIAFDGFELEVLHLPGQTAGHICLYHQASGILFSGDTLLLDISPNPLLEPDPIDPTDRRRSLIEYLASLDRLSTLPLTRVFPGHGPPIEDPRAVIEEMRSHHRRRTETLAHMLDEEGKSAWVSVRRR